MFPESIVAICIKESGLGRGCQIRLHWSGAILHRDRHGIDVLFSLVLPTQRVVKMFANLEGENWISG